MHAGLKRFKARIVLCGAAVAAATIASVAYADEASCKALAGMTFPAKAMQFPNTGAKIMSAEWVAERPNFQAYCKVRSEITPVDPKSTRTLVATNLPALWNNKAVQFGGGGLNGTLVEGTGLLRDDPPGGQPLAKGYVTLGTDGGHPNAKPEIGVFMLNAEAELNNAYGANKNGHDLSLAIVNAYYKAAPKRFYFYGGSEGGRQALVAVQMFPASYDGAVANVPSLNKTLQYIAKNNVWMSTHNGGWMNKAKIHLLAKATMDLCDGLDGLKDGVISKYRACGEPSKPEALRCPDGKDTGDTCLSDKQIAAVKTVRGRFDIGFPLKNGIQTLAGWSVGAEDGPGGYNDQIMAEKAEPKDDDPGSYISGNQFVRYAIMRDANSRGAPDYQKYKQRIVELSNMSDMSNPDLTPFLKRGGKLILKGNGADYQVGAETVFEYYGNVVKKMGQATVDKFVRIYMNPGVAHGGSGLRADGSKVPDKIDLLGQIDNWVEKGEAPGDLTVVAYEKGIPVATKPMCQFPTYPRYQAGNVNVSGSYVCTAF